MTTRQLERYVQHITQKAEEKAAEKDGLDQQIVSNFAHDMTVQDDALTRLCSMLDDLDGLDDGLRHGGRSIDKVRGPILDAGHDLVDAADARAEEIVREAVQKAIAYEFEKENEEVTA